MPSFSVPLHPRASIPFDVPRTRPRPARGFTLLELLIVVAIIGVLAALLVPGLSTVSEKAKRTKCLGNLRQMGSALQLYAADHDGYGPPDNRHAGNSSVSSFRQGPNLFLFGPLLEYMNFPDLQNYLTTTSPVPEIFICPSSRPDLYAVLKSTTGCEYTSYWFNPDVSSNPYKQTKLFNLYQKTIAIMDTCLWWQYEKVDWGPESHQGVGFNFVRLDGSAGWLDKKRTVGSAAGWNFSELSEL